MCHSCTEQVLAQPVLLLRWNSWMTFLVEVSWVLSDSSLCLVFCPLFRSKKLIDSKFLVSRTFCKVFGIYIFPTVKSKNPFCKHFLPKIKFLLFWRNSFLCPIWIFILDNDQAHIYSVHVFRYCPRLSVPWSGRKASGPRSWRRPGLISSILWPVLWSLATPRSTRYS